MSAAFDPFTATLEEAQGQPDAYEVRGAVHRFIGAQNLLERKDYYLQHVLEGVAVCMLHDLVAPRWLAARFLQAQRAVKWAEHRSWDEAFGAPWPKNIKLSSKRMELMTRPLLVALFNGPKALPRTPDGRSRAAAALGITERQVRDWLPKTRRNVRVQASAHPPAASAGTAHDPFGLTKSR